MLAGRLRSLDIGHSRPVSTHSGGRFARLVNVIGIPLTVFLFSRVLLVLIVSHADPLLASPRIKGNGSLLPASDLISAAGSWTRPWFRFDAAWYVSVAEHGYHWGTPAHASTNFLPAYPVFIRLVQPLAAGSAWLSAWLIANAAYLIALVLLWQWSRSRFPGEAALRVLLLLSCFPFAFFYAAPYAESLFLACAVGAFLLAERGYWIPAVALAGMSTVTRPVGLAVVLGIMVLAWQRASWRHACASSLGIIPLAVFALYLGVSFRHPLGFLISHSAGWVHPHGSLLTTLGSQFHTRFSPFDRVDAFVVILFLAGAVAAWRRLGPAYGVYTTTALALPLVHGLVGMERYVIVLFPAFAAVAAVERKALQVAIFAVSIAGTVVFAAMFGAGYTLI